MHSMDKGDVEEGQALGAKAGNCREAPKERELCKGGGGVLAEQRGTQAEQSNTEPEK